MEFVKSGLALAGLLSGLITAAHGLDISGHVRALGGAPISQAQVCLGADTSACLLSAADGSFRITRIATHVGFAAGRRHSFPSQVAGIHRMEGGMAVTSLSTLSDIAGRRIGAPVREDRLVQDETYLPPTARLSSMGDDTLRVSKAGFLTRSYVPVAETESTVVITLDIPLTPPTGLGVSATLNALSVIWNPVAGAGSHSLYFKAGTAIAKTDLHVDEATSPYTLTDLVDGKTYAIGIEARNTSTVSELATLVSSPYRASMAYLGKRGISQGGAQNTEVAMGKTGTPYLSYRDVANGHRATVSRFTGTGWEILGSSGFTPDTAFQPHLALDTSDIPYLAYSHGGRISVMRYAGTAWDTVGPQKFTGRDVLQPVLALAGGGTPYVAFVEADSNRRLSVMKFDGANWVAVGAIGFTGGKSNSPALAVDRNGIPHVAYWETCPDLLNPPALAGKLSAMKFNGAAWDSIGRCMTSGNNTGLHGPLSMKFDTSGSLYLAYADEANGGKATVQAYRSAAWSVVGTASFTAGVAASLSLAIGPSGRPHIAYSNGSADDRADVMRLVGSVWTHAPNPDFSSSKATGTALSVNNLGEVVVGFSDYSTPGARASVARIRFE